MFVNVREDTLSVAACFRGYSKAYDKLFHTDSTWYTRLMSALLEGGYIQLMRSAAEDDR